MKRDARLLVRLIALAGVVALFCPVSAAEAPTRADVVFVCEHGSVKSLIAAQWFNRLASARKLSERAVSRGVAPDASVPETIREGLRRDGLPVDGVKPTPYAPDELKAARRVITIGRAVDAVIDKVGVPYESWPDIPPATQDYAAARDEMLRRIENLLIGLEARRP